MTTNFTKEAQARKEQELQLDCRNWKSALLFTHDEITFMERLLGSYIFEPNTPNLFERLQEYQDRLKAIKQKKARVQTAISQHGNHLGGILECADEACDLGFFQQHAELKVKVAAFNSAFQELKAEIFKYAGGVLKKNKE